tara:strand:- start:2 stop:205 length:204 start_codon:yes stop_codon:yes gene_type:complete
MKQETNNKSMFMIYNYDMILIKEFNSLDDAKHHAINICDHSKEILIKKVDQEIIKDKQCLLWRGDNL